MSNEKYFQDIKVDLKETSETNVVLTAEPFEKGYGVTVGNGMRRTLLTSLPGAAITSLKIDNVTHEFTSIPVATILTLTQPSTLSSHVVP